MLLNRIATRITRLATVFILIHSTAHASEVAFADIFKQIGDKTKEIEVQKREIADNQARLKSLSERSILLEEQIANTIQDIINIPEFNTEALIQKAKETQTDMVTSSSVNRGYESINKEIKSTWKNK